MFKLFVFHMFSHLCVEGLSGAMESISMRSGAPGSPTHLSASSAPSRRRNGLHDVDLNTFIAEEMALHLDNGTRKRSSAQCNDVITDSPTHKRNRMIWALKKTTTMTTTAKYVNKMPLVILPSLFRPGNKSSQQQCSPQPSTFSDWSTEPSWGDRWETVFSAEA